MSIQIQKPLNHLNFLVICFILWLRDRFYPPDYVLNGLKIPPNATLVDFGCGPGNYSIAAAEQLNDAGKIVAVDALSHAIKKVRKKAKKKKISNIKTINSDCETGLPSKSVDVVLLYYVFNDLENPDRVLRELYRILKPKGILSLSEFNVAKISPLLQEKGLFKLQKNSELTHTFKKISK